MSQELMWKLTKRAVQGLRAIWVDTCGDEMVGSGSLMSSDQCSSTFTTETGLSASVLDTGTTNGVRAPTTARAKRRQPRAEDLERIMEDLLISRGRWVYADTSMDQSQRLEDAETPGKSAAHRRLQRMTEP